LNKRRRYKWTDSAQTTLLCGTRLVQVKERFSILTKVFPNATKSFLFSGTKYVKLTSGQDLSYVETITTDLPAIRFTKYAQMFTLGKNLFLQSRYREVRDNPHTLFQVRFTLSSKLFLFCGNPFTHLSALSHPFLFFFAWVTRFCSLP
jgi:hypothetical protein